MSRGALLDCNLLKPVILHLIVDIVAGGGSVTAQLLEADMNIMSPAQCEDTWGVSHREDIHICIVDENNDQGSCNVIFCLHMSF